MGQIRPFFFCFSSNSYARPGLGKVWTFWSSVILTEWLNILFTLRCAFCQGVVTTKKLIATIHVILDFCWEAFTISNPLKSLLLFFVDTVSPGSACHPQNSCDWTSCFDDVLYTNAVIDQVTSCNSIFKVSDQYPWIKQLSDAGNI